VLADLTRLGVRLLAPEVYGFQQRGSACGERSRPAIDTRAELLALFGG
jgi:hypothetical protein